MAKKNKKGRGGEGESGGQEPTSKEGGATGEKDGPHGKGPGDGGKAADGKGPHDGTKQGTGKGPSGGNPPAQAETGPSPAAKQAINKIEDFVSRVEKFQQQWADFDKRKDALDARVANQKDGQGNTADLDEAGKLSKEAAAREKVSKDFVDEGEALSKDLHAAAPQELEQAFGAKDPKGILEAARGGAPGGLPPGEGLAAKAAAKLAGAFFWVQSIDSILKSDDKLDALAQVGANYAVGTAEGAIFQLITDSTPVTMILGMLVGMCGDQGGACEEQERQEWEKAKEKAEVRALHLAVYNYLAKNFPGSVEMVEDDIKVNDRKLWDETVKKIVELKKLKELQKQRDAAREMNKAHKLTPEEMGDRTRNKDPHMNPA
jgi:hypothetical protein